VTFPSRIGPSSPGSSRAGHNPARRTPAVSGEEARRSPGRRAPRGRPRREPTSRDRGAKSGALWRTPRSSRKERGTRSARRVSRNGGAVVAQSSRPLNPSVTRLLTVSALIEWRRVNYCDILYYIRTGVGSSDPTWLGRARGRAEYRRGRSIPVERNPATTGPNGNRPALQRISGSPAIASARAASPLNRSNRLRETPESIRCAVR